MCKNVDLNTPTHGLAFQDAAHGLVGSVIGYLDSGIEEISSEFPDVEESGQEDPEETSGGPVLQEVSTRERTVEQIVDGIFYKMTAFLEIADRGFDTGLHAGTVPVALTLLDKAKVDVVEALSNGKAPDIEPSAEDEQGLNE